MGGVGIDGGWGVGKEEMSVGILWMHMSSCYPYMMWYFNFDTVPHVFDSPFLSFPLPFLFCIRAQKRKINVFLMDMVKVWCSMYTCLCKCTHVC